MYVCPASLFIYLDSAHTTVLKQTGQKTLKSAKDEITRKSAKKNELLQ